MLFNSYEFIFAFLPLVLIGFYVINSVDRRAAILWLGFASLFFYGWWNWRFLPLLVCSILVNFTAGIAMIRLDARQASTARRITVIAAIAANLLALGYFKYMNFFADTMNMVLTHPLVMAKIVLPIGISFYTFTQIAFLVDTYQGLAREARFINYLLFVTYFPHLIAGPIIHHTEMMPQFERKSFSSIAQNVAVGLSTFVIGLFKKVVIADGVAAFATPLFDIGHQTVAPTLVEAWCGTLAYTLQLYFDFSGYSDMAVGLSRMFGIRLPVNFNSPLRARSIIEFWQRWHMTLTRWITLYLFNPMATKVMNWRMDHGYGISRRDSLTPSGFASMVALPLFYAMGLAGIWHGAGMQFAVFGLLHASYLTINRAWRLLTAGRFPRRNWNQGLLNMSSVFLTTVSVLVANVFFRANSVHDAILLLRSMIGLNGFALPQAYAKYVGVLATLLSHFGVTFVPSMPYFTGVNEILYLLLLLGIVWFLPNTQQIMGRYRPALDAMPFSHLPRILVWRVNLMSVVAVALLAVASIMSLSKVSVFLYFQF